MQTSTISTARSINAGREHVGETYPFSVQMKGDKWHVHDARTNAYGETGHDTARSAGLELQAIYTDHIREVRA